MRTLTHRGELAIRAALSGGTAALIRPGLAYATVIAGAGGGLGILGAVVANTWLAGRMSTVLPAWAIFRLDARFTMTAVLAVALVVLVTAVPAVRLSRRTDVMGLISASTQSMPLHVSRLSRSALAAQVAIMLAVTVGAVQVLRSYGEISRVDPGFLAHTILAADIRTPDGALSSPEWRAGLAEIAARLEAVPDIAGVTHRWYVQRTTQWDRRGDAGLDSVALPTGAVPRRSAGLVGEPGALAMNDSIYLDTAPTKRVAYRVSGPTMAYAVGETYFDVTGIGLQAGRAFTRTDNVGGALVAILSRALAAALWPDQSAVGHRFELGPGGPWVDVVGVANDVRVVTASMWEGTLIKPEYTLYLPHA